MTITAKYPGRCKKCGGQINVGDKIEWEHGQGASHVHCPELILSQFEMRTDSVSHLSAGDIWATPRRGIFVVLSVRPAEWSGSQWDTYAHITQWLTCRPATPEESAKWDRIVDAAAAWKKLRSEIGIPQYWKYRDNQLIPPADTRRLDSYDDRWEPPQPIDLIAEQVAIEVEYLDARRALKTN